jgi:sulfate transport system ATP-binding protein
MSAPIVVENLTKRFGNFEAVKDVSFGAEEGRITALLGPSGSGKSTVLRMIAGLEHVSGGQIFIGGVDQTAVTVQERRVGFVFQHYALFRHMTVRDNVAFGLAVRKEAKAAQLERVDELLELVQLAPFANRFPDQLSGGQRQRVALARALAPRPKVLLLDEPFGALDARVRQDLRKWLDELHRELGVTSLLVTHDQEEALELAHRIVVMNEGVVEQIGTPAEVYDKPATPFVAGFVGSANVLQGPVIGGRVQFGTELVAGASHLPDGAFAQAFVRPHDVRITGRQDGLMAEAKVEKITNLGWTSKVVLQLSDEQKVEAEVLNEQIGELHLGQTVWADLRNAKVFQPDGATARSSDELAAL